MPEESGRSEKAWRSRVQFVFLAFGVVAAFFILAEHRAHVLPWLPWLFLAACPLMHVFMHHGHGGRHHGDKGGSDGGRSAAPNPDATAPPGAGNVGTGGTPQHHHGDRR